MAIKTKETFKIHLKLHSPYLSNSLFLLYSKIPKYKKLNEDKNIIKG